MTFASKIYCEAAIYTSYTYFNADTHVLPII